ncbi:Uncharacterised protein [Pannonibacter phragmitetus]|uniref:Glycerophosphoryl diester phosphodiesterase membrane domain-containing protein n=1 Tax=Pannonibacter phragmitetus TaxID=121719 RepID=A0A379A084_9HYPH|nr:hypothetical protein [Pannonibacter phragmitetus]SUB02885.1 Uncharacterised protein [Pannonibacter phragmitetus]
MYSDILHQSATLIRQNINIAFRIAGAWMVIMLVAGALEGASEDVPGLNIILALASLVLTLVSGASIASGWHRFGLLREQPDLIYLRFGIYELRVLGRMLQTFLIVLTPILGFILVSMQLGEVFQDQTMMVITVVFFFLIAVLMYRISFIVPASAVGHRLPVMEAFRISRGYAGPMLVASFLLSIPVFLLLGLALAGGYQILAGGSVILGTVILSVFGALLQITTTTIGLAVVTVAYKDVAERLWAENPGNPMFAQH